MNIGIDLDDVIVDFFPSFLIFYNQKYRKKFELADLTRYHIWEVGIGRDMEEAIVLVDEFFYSEDFINMPLVTGAQAGVEELSKRYGGLVLVTSRPMRWRERTQSFIEHAFPKVPIEVNYSSGLHRQGISKGQICKRGGVDVFVEDCLEYAEECAANRIRTLLLDKPWNQGSNGNVERVYSWDDILEKINRGVKNGI